MVLDEPNSNLDDAGELALIKAILELRQRKAAVMIITHRNSILQVTTKLLLMREGSVALFGTTEQVLEALQQSQAAAAAAAQVPAALPPNGGANPGGAL